MSYIPTPTLQNIKLHFSFNNLLKTTIILSIVVFFSKLFTLTTLHSAENSQQPQEVATQESKQNLKLDSNGMVLKLDFMNLTPEDTEVLESLFNYREQLQEQHSAIARKKDKLKIVESRIQQQIKELKRLKTELGGLLNKYTKEEEQRINMLVKVYESMKAPQAAAIFNDLPENQVLLLLNRMKEAKTALILASMNPQTASELTKLILTTKQLKK